MAKRRMPTENIEVNEVAEEVVDEVVETPTEFTPVIGVVTNCELLNVRAKPSVKSDVIRTIKKDTEVEIDEAKSSRDFYKVCSKDFNGYCMKKFITIKQ